MDSPADPGQKASLSDYFAAERTLLAWIRTGLALMGFGFVVARFGLFLQQLQIMQRTPIERSYGLSLWFGTALIAVGVIVNIFAGWQHLRLIRELDRGTASHSHSSTQAVLIAFFLALVGLTMAIYLVSVRSTTHSKFENGEETTLALNGGNGIIDVPSNYSVDQTVETPQGNTERKGSHAVRTGRSQRRSGKGGNEDASHQTADLREPQGGYASNVGGSQRRHRSPAQSSGLGG